MKKLTVDKADHIADVVERIIETDDSEVTIVIPKESSIGESAGNFRLLHREAAAAGKYLVVESVDENVLALAKESGLGAAHPLFAGERASSVSDIVSVKAKGKADPRAAEAPEPEGEPGETEQISVGRQPEFFESAPRKAIEVGNLPAQKEGRMKLLTKRSGIYKIGAAAVFIVLLAWGGAVLSARLFGSADVVLIFKKTPWHYQGKFLAATAAVSPDLDKGLLPAEVFKQTKNLVQLFPASGRANVSQKATASITIYNVYSSSPQVLVKTTRFETPDGKIFRIDEQVEVPGAEIKDGKIQPASITVNATADKAGPVYNVGPIEKLTIPGLKGSPKFAGFYGTMSAPASGGFVGERATPTGADVESAKSKISDALSKSLAAVLEASEPAGFALPEGASSIRVTKITVNKNTDEKGNFSVFAEAEIKAIGFKEADLEGLLLESAAPSEEHQIFKEISVTYSNLKPNFSTGELAFSISAQGTLTKSFSASDFKSAIAGKKIREVNELVKKLDGLSEAKISVRPRWSGSIPKNQDRISVTAN